MKVKVKYLKKKETVKRSTELTSQLNDELIALLNICLP